MSWSRKYGRTFHYPFSPGTTNDDRINFDWWEEISKIKTVIHTEKLDGENTCLNQHGVFSRSHAAPTLHPWANYLKERWSWMKNDLGNLEIFGENLYAIHSIEYTDLNEHFFTFGIRHLDMWLSWEEVEFYAAFFGLPTVPLLLEEEPVDKVSFEASVLDIIKDVSTFESVDNFTKEVCSMEGIVSKNKEEYPVDDFKENVFKYVRKDHVKTDKHWTRNWKRAKLNWENPNGSE
jgi:hypothetical protein